MKKFLKKYVNFTIILIIAIVTYKIVSDNIKADELEEIMKLANAKYFYIAIFCLFGYYGLEAELIHRMLRKLYPDVKYYVSIKTTLIGQYYSYLTPFASGGQPMQVLYLNKDGVTVADSGAVLVNKFLLFQITVTLYAFLMVIIRFSHIISELGIASSFIFTGILINAVGLTLIVAMTYNPVLIEKFIRFCFNIMSHLNIIKNPQEKLQHLRIFIDEYGKSLNEIFKDRREAILMFMISILQITLYFSIAYFVSLGLGIKNTNIFDILSLQALLYIAVAFIPTPGAAGASEAAFVIVMKSIFVGGYSGIGLLVWRGISYYFGLIVCGIFTFLIHVLDDYLKYDKVKKGE